ncbi:hypothetical protein Lalb_Chr18g0059531 [Lupinus albus]|uniref:Uncharacterized protein n=1 Tax=Lupinus albus TaxID=3870 RepID=A0A6A4P0N4_LUPAL|nr:hypothetical protein Lalb_Chr18g0059531 [Lupinus albus]
MLFEKEVERCNERLEEFPINETEYYSVITSVNAGSSNFHYSPSTCSIPIPIPSAPLLPDNATWFSYVQSSFPAPLLPHNTSQVSAYSDWTSTCAPHGHDPRMTSSEWLCWYRENYKHEWTNNYMQPSFTHSNVPGNHENLLYNDTYRFNDQFDNKEIFSIYPFILLKYILVHNQLLIELIILGCACKLKEEKQIKFMIF